MISRTCRAPKPRAVNGGILRYRNYTIIALYGDVFDFDPGKSAANKAKHGIDFVEAQVLWQGVTATVPSDYVEGPEARNLVVGEIAGKRWTAVTTTRGEAIRIISVRRSRKDEEFLYEQAQQSHR